MSPFIYALLRFIHFLGIIVGAGGSLAGASALSNARRQEAPEKAGYEGAAADTVTKVELPGLFLALFGGIGLVAVNPNVLDPKTSGAGPWLHVKLALVFVLLIVAHLRMFRSRRLVRERAAGASEADCDALLRSARAFARADAALLVAILVVALFRFTIFA